MSVCVDSSDEAGPAVTVAGMCPAIDRNRGREEREREKESKKVNGDSQI